MEQEIETLRQELNRLVKENKCLNYDKIVKLNRELDNLIYAYLYMYYLAVKSAKKIKAQKGKKTFNQTPFMMVP